MLQTCTDDSGGDDTEDKSQSAELEISFREPGRTFLERVTQMGSPPSNDGRGADIVFQFEIQNDF